MSDMIIVAFVTTCSIGQDPSEEFRVAKPLLASAGLDAGGQIEAPTHPLRVKQWTADG
jgi:hypothetical protein